MWRDIKVTSYTGTCEMSCYECGLSVIVPDVDVIWSHMNAMETKNVTAYACDKVWCDMNQIDVTL